MGAACACAARGIGIIAATHHALGARLQQRPTRRRAVRRHVAPTLPCGRRREASAYWPAPACTPPRRRRDARRRGGVSAVRVVRCSATFWFLRSNHEVSSAHKMTDLQTKRVNCERSKKCRRHMTNRPLRRVDKMHGCCDDAAASNARWQWTVNVTQILSTRKRLLHHRYISTRARGIALCRVSAPCPSTDDHPRLHRVAPHHQSHWLSHPRRLPWICRQPVPPVQRSLDL